MNRPPVVTILGHVDHGKTSLLDTIRKSRLAAKEHGGITQRIGGYEISTGLKGYNTDKITFIDTPGMKRSLNSARGCACCDVAILIDAVDSVMPQTIESSAHKEYGYPYIVALNKTDFNGKSEEVKRIFKT
jgi:translation initiation factor IF-2